METTHSIWGILDEQLPLRPLKGDGSNTKNCILFEMSEDSDDGTYPRVCDYTRYANALEREGASYFINRCSRKKNKAVVEFYGTGGVKIIRNKDYETEAILEFPEPIEVVMGKVGDREIIEKVKRIKGEFTYDWYWIKNGRQDKIANGFEIYFNIKEYLE
jgi:hypothetical protein